MSSYRPILIGLSALLLLPSSGAAANGRETLLPLRLKTGWNAFSLPAQPLTSDPDAFFADAKVGQVWCWSDEAFRPAVQLAPGNGYFVYSPAPVEIDYRCLELTTPLTRSGSGWQLLGALSSSPQADGVGPVWRAGGDRLHRHEAPLQPGEAYWVFLDGANMQLGSNQDDRDGDGVPDYWAAAWRLADGQSGNADDDLVDNLSEYKAGTSPAAADSDGDGLADWLDRNLAPVIRFPPPLPPLPPGAFPELDAALSWVAGLQTASAFTLTDAEYGRSLQRQLRQLIVDAGVPTPWAAGFVQFNTALDAVLASKALRVPLADDRALLLENPTDVLTRIAEHYRLMTTTGAIEYQRFAGVEPADVAGLDLLADYSRDRALTPLFELPSFAVPSPLGQLQFLDRVARRFAAARDTTTFDLAAFLRFLDGTEVAYQQGRAAIAQALAAHPVALPASPMQIADVLDTLNAFHELNAALRTEVGAVIDAFTGEAVFRQRLIAQLAGDINNRSTPGAGAYGTLWYQLSTRWWYPSVRYVRDTVTVTVSAGNLGEFVAGLPYDLATLRLFPGVQSSVDQSRFATLISAEYFNALASVDLDRQPPLPATVTLDPDATPAILAIPAHHLQLLELFLDTWPEVIDGAGVDFDLLRSRLLLNDALEAALTDAAAELRAYQSAIAALDRSDGAASYLAGRQLLEAARASLITRFEPLLSDVVYSTRNEISVRVDDRYAAVVAAFDDLVAEAMLGPVDPRVLLAAAVQGTLSSIAIARYDGRFERSAYLRLPGLEAADLVDLRSPGDLTQLRAFSFYPAMPATAPVTFADAELWYRLLPRLIDRHGTADAATLASALLDGLQPPVPPGQDLAATIRALAQSHGNAALAEMGAAPLLSIADLQRVRGAFARSAADLRLALTPYVAGLEAWERGSLESWLNWQSGSAWRQLRQRYDGLVAGIGDLEVAGVIVPVPAILAIERFPDDRNFDAELFVGLAAADVDAAESAATADQYRVLKLQGQSSYASERLSAAGRVELIATTVSRLLPAAAAGLVAGGRIEVEAFRQYLKGVPEMLARVNALAASRVQEAAAALPQRMQASMTADALMSVYTEVVLGTRGDLIAMLDDQASRHERGDVMRAEAPLTAIFQQQVFDVFVASARSTTIVVRGTDVPVAEITQRVLQFVQSRLDGEALAAYHLARLPGIGLADVRELHKLESYLGEQLIVLPRTSAYVKVVSQVSELGFIQLAALLVDRWSDEIVAADGEIDIPGLLLLLADLDAAVARIQAVTTSRCQAAALALDGSLATAVQATADLRLDLTATLNDFISGLSPSTISELQPQLEAHAQACLQTFTAARDAAFRRDGIVVPLEIDGHAMELAVALDESTVDRFIAWTAAYVGGLPPAPATVSDAGLWPAPGLADIGIWLPLPQPTYDPDAHATWFGMAQLFAALVAEFGEFAVSADVDSGQLQLDMDRFEAELLLTDADRAARRIARLEAEALPSLQAQVAALQDDTGALPLTEAAGLTENVEAIRNRLLVLADAAPGPAQASWDRFVAVYEAALFRGRLSLEIDGRVVRFAPADLDALLLDAYNDGELDADLIAQFSSLIRGGETTWAYETWRNLLNYPIWLTDLGSAGGSLALTTTSGGDSDAESWAGDFSLADLARVPAIDAADLAAVETAELNRLQLSPIEAHELLGLLNVRALAPGSGVGTGGILAAGAEGDAVLAPDAIFAPEPALPYTSIRFRALELLPAILRHLAVVWDDDEVVGERFAELIRGPDDGI